jgi:cysteine desulfuration protein SufE
MTSTHDPIPEKLRRIISDFGSSEGREKLELLLQYAEEMPSLPEWLRDRSTMDQVEECMTPVFIDATRHDGKLTFHFDVPRSSPTVRGFATILKMGLDGSTSEEILAVPGDFFERMGLEDVLTYQRLRGISAMLAHMKQLALRELEAS